MTSKAHQVLNATNRKLTKSSSFRRNMGELTLEDLMVVPKPQHRSTGERHHSSMSALKIADEAFDFGATRLTGPAVFNEEVVAEDRRKRLASLKVQNHEKAKSLRNMYKQANKELSSSSAHAKLDLEGDTSRGGTFSTDQGEGHKSIHNSSFRKAKSLRNILGQTKHSSSSANLELDGGTNHSEGGKSNNGSYRGLFRRFSSVFTGAHQWRKLG